MSEPLYLTEYMKVKNMGSNKQLKWSGKRGDLTKEFGWTIPNKSIIEFLVQESQKEPLYEIGAGNGYLSYEIQKYGGETIPIDIEIPEKTWSNVKEMSYEKLNPKSVSRIILPWPPANSPMGGKCIQYLSPSVVYFIGKSNSNITGTKEMHELLTNKYNCVEEIELPSWTDNPTMFKKYVR